MAETSSVFTIKVAELLASIRKKSGLSQTDIAKHIGLSEKSGKKYISNLEIGRIKNPSFNTIILYLDACNTSYDTFFTKLSQIRFTERHQEIMRNMPSNIKPNLRQKIDRDTALYTNKIKHQIKTPKLDIHKLKSKIERELAKYLSDHRIDKNLTPTYQDFTSHILTRVLNPNLNPPLDTSPWDKPGIRPMLLNYINRMVYKIVHREQNKLSRRKLPTTEKQKKMVIGFLKYRIMIEQVEAEVHKLLNELEVPFIYYQGYKDFARQCFSNLKKLYYKDQSLLSQRFKESILMWQRMKLDENVLQKVKEITIQQFLALFPKPQ
jgi:transcriptional regulator with XRE-family HTH domain